MATFPEFHYLKGIPQEHKREKQFFYEAEKETGEDALLSGLHRPGSRRHNIALAFDGPAYACFRGIFFVVGEVSHFPKAGMQV